MATVLSAFVTGIFVWLGSVPLAIVFGVVTLGCLAVLVGALVWRRRARS